MFDLPCLFGHFQQYGSPMTLSFVQDDASVTDTETSSKSDGQPKRELFCDSRGLNSYRLPLKGSS